MTSDEFLDPIYSHYANELPFVIYSKPNETYVRALLQNDSSINYVTDFKASGFIFAPFNAEDKTVIIPHNRSKFIEAKEVHFSDSISSETLNLNIDKRSQQEKENYIFNVNKAISRIEAGDFQKVVLSREETVAYKNTNPIALFTTLLNTYKTAFTYCFYHPKVGLWLGATPETFLSIEGQRLKTMSLAGTQKASSLNAVWQTKELEEQQLVTNFIIDAITPLVTNLNIGELETVQAGNLLHLKTTISGVLNKETFSLKELLYKMHPTPAVCGIPKERAKKFILETETYNRAFYTGFLGELNFKEKRSRNTNKRNIENNAYASLKPVTTLFVNLRCMQLKDDNAITYVGGGITKDSISEKEWEETVNKSQTMKKVLR